jgi:Leucine-rich repeat (LRR) protein
VKTLPSTLLHPLENLVYFSMAYNNLTNIPNDLFVANVKLETLNLAHNLLATFDDKQFESLSNLERVDLDHNR